MIKWSNIVVHLVIVCQTTANNQICVLYMVPYSYGPAVYGSKVGSIFIGRLLTDPQYNADDWFYCFVWM